MDMEHIQFKVEVSLFSLPLDRGSQNLRVKDRDLPSFVNWCELVCWP